MKRIGVVVSLAFIACVSFAQVYKWTDSQGVIHFSDTPHAGAETINNIQTQGYSSPPIPSSVPSIQNPSTTKKQETYTKLAITQPADQSTIRNNQGYVVVTIEVEPQLLPGNSIQILFDGKAQGTPQNSLMFQLNGIYRGSHTIAVQILDANGEVLKTSPPVTIFMQRPRVGMVKRPGQ